MLDAPVYAGSKMSSTSPSCLGCPSTYAVTLDFEPRYALWERAPSYAVLGGGGAGAAASRVFNVTAVVRINRQPILYSPPVSEVLQAGWSKVRKIRELCLRLVGKRVLCTVDGSLHVRGTRQPVGYRKELLRLATHSILHEQFATSSADG